ncbi:MAG: hypothetical protein ACPGWM_10730, partial [Flavobacteriales bacterium]
MGAYTAYAPAVIYDIPFSSADSLIQNNSTLRQVASGVQATAVGLTYAAAGLLITTPYARQAVTRFIPNDAPRERITELPFTIEDLDSRTTIYPITGDECARSTYSQSLYNCNFGDGTELTFRPSGNETIATTTPIIPPQENVQGQSEDYQQPSHSTNYNILRLTGMENAFCTFSVINTHPNHIRHLSQLIQNDIKYNGLTAQEASNRLLGNTATSYGLNPTYFDTSARDIDSLRGTSPEIDLSKTPLNLVRTCFTDIPDVSIPESLSDISLATLEGYNNMKTSLRQIAYFTEFISDLSSLLGNQKYLQEESENPLPFDLYLLNGGGFKNRDNGELLLSLIRQINPIDHEGDIGPIQWFRNKIDSSEENRVPKATLEQFLEIFEDP